MKVNEYLETEKQQRDQAVIDTEQRQAAAANTDLREACRQYYWPHRSFTGAIADKIKWLEGLDYNKRDAVLLAHGQRTQRDEKTTREQMHNMGIIPESALVRVRETDS